jgi:hypothetical protein
MAAKVISSSAVQCLQLPIDNGSLTGRIKKGRKKEIKKSKERKKKK